MAASAGGRGTWSWWPLLLVALTLGWTFHEGLTGTGSIAGRAYLPYLDALYGGPRTPPVPVFDNSATVIHQPWDAFMMSCFHAGKLPTWQPLAGFGTPLLANGQSAPFFPLKWLFFWAHGTTDLAEAWYFVSERALAAVGMTALAWRLGFSPAAVAVAALVAALNGFGLYHLRLPEDAPMALVPALLWAAMRFAERPDARAVGLLGLLIGLTGLSGHPEPALYTGAAAVLACGLLLAGRRAPAGVWGRLAAACALGAGVAAIAVWPFLVLARGSTSYLFERGSSVFSVFAELWTLSHALVSMAGHLFSANARGDVGTFNSFVGAVVLVLACVGFGVAGTARRLAVLLLGLLLGILVLCPPTTPHQLLALLPNSFYAVGLIAPALGLLAGSGLDALGSRRWLTAALAAVFALAGAGLQLVGVAHDGGSYVGFTLAAAAMALLLAVGRPRVLGPALAVLAACELSAAGRVAVPPLPVAIGSPSPALAFLQRQVPGTRVATDGTVMPPNTGLNAGIDTLDLLEAFFPPRYLAFWTALHQASHPTGTTMTLAPDFRPALLDLASVGFVLATPGPVAAAAARVYPLAFSDGKVKVFKNPAVLARARVVYGADCQAPDPKLAASRLLARPARYRDHVLLEGGEPPGGPMRPPTPATVILREADRLAVRAHAVQAGYLVLNEGFDPGWQASVDGKPAAVIPANLAFRAVALPPGEHLVEFLYRPASVARGGLLSLGALLLAALLIVLGARRPAWLPRS